MVTAFSEMIRTFAKPGQVDWIGLRPARKAALEVPKMVQVDESGLVGDHGRSGKRAVTLIQAEHLPVIASILGVEAVRPEDLRRNVVVSGINLTALKKRHVQVGSAILHLEGPCPPCSRMEKTLGTGGYSAVRGHGGWYASVVEPGEISLQDRVIPAD
ncbi:MAG: MOSC domain-containing protein [Rhodobacteraceae bacterium]|nr:MOSC domain-containing protein [Paracoccaceae bacterium]